MFCVFSALRCLKTQASEVQKALPKLPVQQLPSTLVIHAAGGPAVPSSQADAALTSSKAGESDAPALLEGQEGTGSPKAASKPKRRRGKASKQSSAS